MENKKLEFYGGEWMSFLPLGLFLVGIIYTTFFVGSISDGALWLPAFLAICISLFFAKDKKVYTNAVINGIASPDAIIPVICWFFAGVFSRILRSSGLADAIAGTSANLGVGETMFLVITFLACALFATASGTGFGTIAAGMGVMYPAGLALGCNGPLLCGIIISGAAFGDNLAPVSDTTICSATSQGVDVPGVVRSRFKYSAVAAVITVIAIFIVGPMTKGSMEPYASELEYNPLAFLMLIAVVLTVIVAMKTGDIIIATVLGGIIGSIIGVACGLFKFVSVSTDGNVENALFTISNKGDVLNCTFGGIVQTGLSSMLQVCVLCMLLFGSISCLRAGGGDKKLLEVMSRGVKTAVGAELIISAMVIVLSSIMGLNAPAILTVGASFARPMSETYGFTGYRAANLLDGQSNTLCYCVPWGAGVIYAIGFAAETAVPLAAVSVTPCPIYCYALLVVLTASIFLHIGDHDGEEYLKKLKAEQNK